MMAKVMVFFQNEENTKNPNFDQLSENLQGETISLSRIPCVGEFVDISNPKDPRGNGISFRVIQVSLWATRKDEAPNEVEGMIKLSRCLFDPDW